MLIGAAPAGQGKPTGRIGAVCISLMLVASGKAAPHYSQPAWI